MPPKKSSTLNRELAAPVVFGQGCSRVDLTRHPRCHQDLLHLIPAHKPHVQVGYEPAMQLDLNESVSVYSGVAVPAVAAPMTAPLSLACPSLSADMDLGVALVLTSPSRVDITAGSCVRFEPCWLTLELTSPPPPSAAGQPPALLLQLLDDPGWLPLEARPSLLVCPLPPLSLSLSFSLSLYLSLIPSHTRWGM